MHAAPDAQSASRTFARTVASAALCGRNPVISSPLKPGARDWNESELRATCVTLDPPRNVPLGKALRQTDLRRLSERSTGGGATIISQHSPGSMRMDSVAHPCRQTLRELVVRSDDHPAFLMPRTGMRVSYRALQHALDDAQGAIGALGISSGDRVALSFTNGPEVLISFFAVVACGAAAAPLNPAFSEPELHAELDDLRISHLLHDPASAPRAAAAIAGSTAHAFGVALQDDKLQIDGAPAPARAHDAPPAADADSIALLLHTSGTTSKPKTVPIRQRNLVASTHVIAQTYDLGPDDVTLCVMPLFHVHGLVRVGPRDACDRRDRRPAAALSASSFWDDVREFDVTWYTAVPTIHASVLTKAAELGAGPEHRLRFVRSCSSPLPVPTWRTYETAIDVPLVEAYGMTEAAHQISSNPLPPRERRAGTVGQRDRCGDRDSRRHVAVGAGR